jgi:hypothetical protein
MHLGISEERRFFHAKAQRAQRNPLWKRGSALRPLRLLRERSSRYEYFLSLLSGGGEDGELGAKGTELRGAGDA